MNIAFDGAAILGPLSRNRGIGNYALNQFENMVKKDVANKYFFFNLFDEFSMKDVIGTENIEDVYFYTGDNQELISKESYSCILGDIIKHFIKKYDIDVFYITSPFESHMVRYRKEWFEDVFVIATVYDIIPYVMKKKYLANKSTYKFYIECVDMLRWVDQYLVISQSVKDDMVSYLDFPQDRIHVIYGAANSDIFKPLSMSSQEKKEIIDRYGIKQEFIMCTGGDDDRKNIEGLMRAYAKTKPEVKGQYQLVIVCKLSSSALEKYSRIRSDLHMTDRIIFTNFVPTEDLVKLYNLAALMAFPSLYEGFGLPVVEAWKCGTPVLTSENSSLGEIGKDGAVLVNPESVLSITEGLNRALLSTDLTELMKKGQERLKIFTWDNVSEKTLEVIHSFSDRKAFCDKNTVQYIAMFTPLPPIESGIADYSVDIISQLKGTFKIDVYIDKYQTSFKENEKVKILSYKEFEKNVTKYDRIIYQVGNSLYHKYMFSYIRKYPGIVVLHDYNMRNVLEAIYLYKESKPQEFKKKLSEDYSKEIVDEYMNNLNTNYTNSFEVNGFITNYAKKIIVHSNYAKRKLLEKDIGRDVTVIPLYATIDSKKIDNNEAKKRMHIKENEISFMAFGHIHETKRIKPILYAFGRLIKEEPSINSKLYLVGKMSETIKEDFSRIVRELHLKEKVIVTGYTTLDDFQIYMDASDICFNLRYPYNGESSASFMRLLGKGKCIIINKIGSFNEVPDDICIKIDNVENLTSEEEVEQIYNAMTIALNEKERKGIEERAFKYAQENLNLEIVGKQYIQTIQAPLKSCSLTENLIRDISSNCMANASKEKIVSLAQTLSFSKTLDV